MIETNMYFYPFCSGQQRQAGCSAGGYFLPQVHLDLDFTGQKFLSIP
jgi:hypothetical protein